MPLIGTAISGTSSVLEMITISSLLIVRYSFEILVLRSTSLAALLCYLLAEPSDQTFVWKMWQHQCGGRGAIDVKETMKMVQTCAQKSSMVLKAVKLNGFMGVWA